MTAVEPTPAEETYPDLALLAQAEAERAIRGSEVDEARAALREINGLRKEVERLERRNESNRLLIDELSSWRAVHLRVQAADERARRLGTDWR